jgi:hypothetical protein
MAFTVTPFRRRLAMAAMLALAVSGGVIRYYAPNPSTLRDIGTLLLVLWLPAIGNLIGYLSRKLPRGTPPPTGFAPGSAFAPQLAVEIQTVALPSGFAEALGTQIDAGTVVIGRRGFTVRMGRPVSQVLTVAGPQELAFELLAPAAALRYLEPGAAFHLLVGTTAVAKGRVTSRLASPAAASS